MTYTGATSSHIVSSSSPKLLDILHINVSSLIYLEKLDRTLRINLPCFPMAECMFFFLFCFRPGTGRLASNWTLFTWVVTLWLVYLSYSLQLLFTFFKYWLFTFGRVYHLINLFSPVNFVLFCFWHFPSYNVGCRNILRLTQLQHLSFLVPYLQLPT